MGRFADPYGDDNRLPEGMKQTGYDADTGQKYYVDTADGSSWVGAPYASYGVLTRISGGTSARAYNSTSNVNLRTIIPRRTATISRDPTPKQTSAILPRNTISRAIHDEPATSSHHMSEKNTSPLPKDIATELTGRERRATEKDDFVSAWVDAQSHRSSTILRRASEQGEHVKGISDLKADATVKKKSNFSHQRAVEENRSAKDALKPEAKRPSRSDHASFPQRRDTVRGTRAKDDPKPNDKIGSIPSTSRHKHDEEKEWHEKSELKPEVKKRFDHPPDPQKRDVIDNISAKDDSMAEVDNESRVRPDNPSRSRKSIMRRTIVPESTTTVDIPPTPPPKLPTTYQHRAASGDPRRHTIDGFVPPPLSSPEKTPEMTEDGEVRTKSGLFRRFTQRLLPKK